MATVASPPAMAGECVTDLTEENNNNNKHAHRVLTPPTSEDMNKHDGNSSDLTDIDDDDDVEEMDEIKPDHYWDEENGGRIPVFKPTMDQFRDFKNFIDRIDAYGMQSGIVKVIPPKEWRDSLPRLDESIKSIRVKNPITQEFAGTHGTYTQANIEKQRTYNLPQWKNLCEESNHKTPARKGDRRREAAAAKAAKPARTASSIANCDGQKRRGRPVRNASKLKQEDVPAESIESDLQVPPTPTSPDHAADVDGDDEDHTPSKGKPGPKARGRGKAKPGTKLVLKTGQKAAGRQPRPAKDVKKSVASRRLHNQVDAYEIDEAAFDDFEYHLDNVEQFDVDRCRELEETYWKTINFGTPMYGADMPGSLFEDRITSWNVAHLPNLLDVLGTKVPGVNTAYLYLGMWKATFAWHLEDVDLYSINYIHFGAPKQWYSISQAEARKFEQAMRTIWPQDYKHCDQFLRHKTYLISPEKLKSQFGIKVNKLVHHEGEFVITYPYGYHSGFNLGYNCAESVNFATEEWLNYGRIAKKCLCEADSVWVDVNEIERKLRGEPTPEYYEVTDDESDEEDVLPTPPPSLVGKKTATRKRKRPEEKPKDVAKRKVKRVKLRLRTHNREPCVLCPNDVRFDVLIPTDNGKQAHRLCALYTPETYLRTDPVTKSEMVCNVAHIDKARLELKCNFCRSKKGSCFQCASKKCTRAFHATCAAAAGVLVDEGPVPTWDEDGTEYFYDGFDFRCRFHRPRRPKNHDGKLGENLETNKLIIKYAKHLTAGQIVQAQCLDSEVFAGTVVENRPSEGALIIDVEPVGDRIEIEYKYLLVLDESQSQRPKPSPDAKPLPEHLTTEKVSADNRQDGVPSKGDPFMDPDAGQKWEEFNYVHSTEVKNPFQKNVDVEKAEHLWHYVGPGSTEAKPQYTDDLAKKVHNPKSNFLDTVREPVAPKTSYTAPARPAHTGYPSYGPNGVGIVPRPTHPLQVQSDRPYAYKPKQALQPNVYKTQLPYTSQWQNYTPPSRQQNTAPAPHPPQYTHSRISTQPQAGPSPLHYSSPQAKAQSTQRPSASSQHKASSTTGSFYQQAEQRYAQAPPSNSKCYQMPSASPSTQSLKGTPIASMLGTTSSAMSVPGFQKSVAKPTSIEYASHLKQYPYLRNVFVRRPEKYVSPYAGNFGFSAENEQKIQQKLAARRSSSYHSLSQSSESNGQPVTHVELAPASALETKAHISANPSHLSAPMSTTPPPPLRGYPANAANDLVQYQIPQDFRHKTTQLTKPTVAPSHHTHLRDVSNITQQSTGKTPARSTMSAQSQQQMHKDATHNSSAPMKGINSVLADAVPTPILPAPIPSWSTNSKGKPPYDPTRSPVRPDYSPISTSATPVLQPVPTSDAKGLDSYKI